MTNNNKMEVTYNDEKENIAIKIEAIRDELISKAKLLQSLYRKIELEFDEPVESLQSLSREEILKQLEELSSSGKQMIIVTHIMETINEVKELQAKLKELEASK